MKKLRNILTGVLATAAVAACTTDLDEAAFNPSQTVPPALSVPATLDLSQQEASFAFDVQPVDYGFPAAVKYTLNIGKKESEPPVTFDGAVADGRMTVERFAFNNAMIAAGLPAAEATQVSMWVEAVMINSKNQPLEATRSVSEKMACKVTPYVWSVYGAVGGEDASAIIDMKETAANIWLADKLVVNGPFRFVLNHGTTGGLGGTVESFQSEFDVSESGESVDLSGLDGFEAGMRYNVRLNTETNRASVSIPNTTWSLIGVNEDWNKDLDMDEVIEGVWVRSGIDMEGTFKLRYAGDWDNNRGGSLVSLGEPFAVVNNGDNVSLPKKSTYQVIYHVALDRLIVSEALPETSQWRVIGGGVYGSNWDADYFMTQGADGKWFVRNVYVDGKFKIRNTPDWSDQDRGGVFTALDQPFEVTQGGSDIALKKNWYDIVYDPGTETITVSKGMAYSEGSGGEEDQVTYPASVGLTGDFSGYSWAPADAPTYACDADGLATGYVAMGGAGDAFEFKVTHLKEGSTSDYEWIGGTETSNADGVTVFQLGAGSNMKLAANPYHVAVNLAANTATFTTLKAGLVGDATPGGWDNDTPLTFDPATGLLSANVNFSEGKFKVRFNGSWDYNLGGSLEAMVHNGSDIAVTAGSYIVTLDISKTPAVMSLTPNGEGGEQQPETPAFPEAVGFTGNFSGYNWDPAAAPMFACNSKTGDASGYIAMGGESIEFKLTHLKEGSESYKWIGGALSSTAEDGTMNYLLGTDGNMTVAAGSYFFKVGLGSDALSLVPLKAGLIGDATPGGWDSDTAMTFDAATGLWSCDVALAAGKMKVRFNGGWTYNLGGSLEAMVHDGSDIVVEAGNYTVTLDMSKSPARMTLTAK